MSRNKYTSVFLLTTLLLGLGSCNINNQEQFELPENVTLKNGQFFDPINADQILGNPNRTGSIWSDSLMQLCEIKNITIQSKDQKEGDQIDQEFVYELNKYGKTAKFKYFEYSKSDKPLSKSNFYYSKHKYLDSIEAVRFYGIDSHNKLRIHTENEQQHLIYDKGKGKQDEIIHYFKNKKLKMTVKKIGDVITHISYYVPVNTPVSVLKKMSQEISSENSKIELAEKDVTYLRSGLPLVSYMINTDWAELDKIHEWNYDQNNNLIQYKEWINKALIKDTKFNYSTENVLLSFTIDSQIYSVNFN